MAVETLSFSICSSATTRKSCSHVVRIGHTRNFSDFSKHYYALDGCYFVCFAAYGFQETY